MGEEEMSVLIVGITADVELRHLCTALTADSLRLAVLLTDEGLDTELTELEVGFDTEERFAAPDKRGRKIHGDVTRLDRLDDVVLFAFVVQFEVLLVKGEGGFCVIGKVEVESRTHFTLDAGLYLLIEIEDVVVACACSKRRVGDILVFESEEQFSRTLHLELHTAGTEHFIGRTDVKLHIGDVEFRFVVMLHFAYLLLPVAVHELAFGITVVFLLREHVRRSDIGIAHLGADDIGARLGLVLYGRGDVGWVVEVQ